MTARATSISVHEGIVRDIVGSFGAQRRGFMRTVKSILDDELRGNVEDSKIGIIPDAFRVDGENKVILALEVEVNYKLTKTKLEQYLDLRDALWECNWDLHIAIIDRFGNVNAIDTGALFVESARFDD